MHHIIMYNLVEAAGRNCTLKSKSNMLLIYHLTFLPEMGTFGQARTCSCLTVFCPEERLTESNRKPRKCLENLVFYFSSFATDVYMHLHMWPAQSAGRLAGCLQIKWRGFKVKSIYFSVPILVIHSCYALTEMFLQWLEKKKYHSLWCFLYLAESQKQLSLLVDIQHVPGTCSQEILWVTFCSEGNALATT